MTETVIKEEKEDNTWLESLEELEDDEEEDVEPFSWENNPENPDTEKPKIRFIRPTSEIIRIIENIQPIVEEAPKIDIFPKNYPIPYIEDKDGNKVIDWSDPKVISPNMGEIEKHESTIEAPPESTPHIVTQSTPEETKSDKEIPWWDRKPDPEASKEQLLKQIEEIQVARKAVPRLLLFKQTASIIYLIINILFLYTSLNTQAEFYVAIYMVPLSIVLIDYILVVKTIKDRATGEN